jgi:hypothetical protein
VLNQTRSLPVAAADVVDSAMALVCSLPASGRNERRASVHAVISQATSWHDLENGISFSFENSDAIATALLDLVLAERTCCAQFTYSILFEPEHRPIELRVEATGASVWLLKELFSRTLGSPATGSTTQRDAQSLPTGNAKTSRVLGGVGVLACIVGCVSFPGVTAAVSALGLGVLRNNRVLSTAEGLGLVILLLAVVAIVAWNRRLRKRSAR